MSEQTLIGFDFGEWKIGIAVGQTLTNTATPLSILKSHNKKPDWQQIEKMIKEWQPDALVVGVPLTMYDEEQAMTEMARRFCRQLHGRYKLPVYEADERLSTREAQNQTGTDRNVDAIAAQIILEGWMSKNEDEARSNAKMASSKKLER